MKKWRHQHTLGAGVLIGLMLTGHVFVVALLALTVGVVVGRFWNWLVMVEEAVRMKWFHNKKPRSFKKPPPDDTIQMPRTQVGPHDPWPGEQF